MLFGKGSSINYSLPVLKHIAEILVSNDENLCKQLRVVSADNIVQALKEVGDNSATDLGRLRNYILLIRNDETYIREFDRKLTRYMMTFSYDRLPLEYSKIGQVQKTLRDHLSNLLSGDKSTKMSDAAWSEISLMLETWIGNYSTGSSYNAKDNGLVGFLISSSDFFFSSKKQELFNIMNTRGLNTEFEDSDYSRGDMMTTELVYKEDLDNFQELVGNILESTKFLYKHNRVYFYDLLSRYKFAVVERRRAQLAAYLSSFFTHASHYQVPYEQDLNLNVTLFNNSLKYANEKKNFREEPLQILDRMLTDFIGPKELRKFKNDIISADYKTFLSRQGKENSSIFRFPRDGDWSNLDRKNWYTPSDGMNSNEERVEKLLLAFASLRTIIDYARRQNINVLSIRSDIFRNPSLLNRFRSFHEYYEYLDDVLELIENEPALDKLEDPDLELKDNATLHETILNFNKDKISKIGMYSIRNALIAYNSVRSSPVVAEPMINKERFRGVIESNKAFDISKEAAESFKRKETVKLKPFFNMQQHIINVLFPAIFGEMLKRGIRANDSGYYNWSDFPVYSWLEGNGMGNYLNMLKYYVGVDSEDDKVVVMRILRNFYFGRSFSNYIKDSVVKLLEVARGQHRLDLIILFSEEQERFNMTKNPRSLSEIEWFIQTYNINYCMVDGMDVEQIERHLISLYNQYYNEYLEFFSYVNELKQKHVTETAKLLNLKQRNREEVSKDLLVSIATQLYYLNITKPVAGTPEFHDFVNTNKIDDSTGFVLKSDKLYHQDLFGRGDKYYLHKTGYWVRISANGNNDKIAVSASYNVG